MFSHAGPAVLSVTALVLGWETYAEFASISPMALPAPSSILAQDLENREALAGQTLATLQATLFGFASSLTDHGLRSMNYMNVIVAGKQPAPQWLDMEAATCHCREGIGIWHWASSAGEPDLVMACAGDSRRWKRWPPSTFFGNVCQI